MFVLQLYAVKRADIVETFLLPSPSGSSRMGIVLTNIEKYMVQHNVFERGHVCLASTRPIPNLIYEHKTSTKYRVHAKVKCLEVVDPFVIRPPQTMFEHFPILLGCWHCNLLHSCGGDASHHEGAQLGPGFMQM